MLRHTLAFTALIIASSACSAGSGGGAKPEPEAGSGLDARAVPRLVDVVVLRSGGSFQVGDTIAVDLDAISDEGTVDVYSGGSLKGSIRLDLLGPTEASAMIVEADRLNVRRCRSRGCSIAGYVERRQQVQVRDYAGGWYRMMLEGEQAGYLRAEHLRLPIALRAGTLADIRGRTAEFYRRSLIGLAGQGGDGVFSGHDVRALDDLLSFEFYALDAQVGDRDTICNAMRQIADFVHATMSTVPPGVFPAYSAGVYQGVPDPAALSEAGIAGLTGDGGVYCDSSN